MKYIQEKVDVWQSSLGCTMTWTEPARQERWKVYYFVNIELNSIKIDDFHIPTIIIPEAGRQLQFINILRIALYGLLKIFDFSYLWSSYIFLILGW